MDFTEAPGSRRVRVSERGADILTLTVRPSGPISVDRRPTIGYTAQGGKTLEFHVPVFGHMQVRPGSGGGELVLGDHEVGERLRRLQITPTPLMVMSYVDNCSAWDAPNRVVGPARDYPAYPGTDDEFARYTVSYPTSAPIDQYADLREAA